MNILNFIKNDTFVKYNDFSEMTAKIIGVHPVDREKKLHYIFTDQTNFHPVDFRWKDQPADRGSMTLGEVKKDVISCVVAAVKKDSGELYIDEEIKTKRGDDKWFFLVAHLIDADEIFLHALINKDVILEVDKAYRFSLSSAHTLAHFSSLALNKASSSFWSKETYLDSLGSKSLDSEAIQHSLIMPCKSIDRYRLGKSLRKKGFEANRFLNELPKLEEEIKGIISGWVSKKDLNIVVSPEKNKLTEKREWRCNLPEGTAIIPCGGTHLHNWPISLNFTISLQMLSKPYEFNMISTVEVV